MKRTSDFTRTLPVHVADGAAKQLSVTVAVTGGDDSLAFKLTSPQNVFLLFSLHLTRSDFDALKERQALLVSFDAFQNMTKQLFDECIAAPTRFEAILRVSNSHQPSVLSIVETNAFRHITHLSLDFVGGSDHEIKLHLASLVTLLEQQVKQLDDSLKDSQNDLGSKLADCRNQVVLLKRELDELKVAYAEQASKLELQASLKLQSEREEFSRERDSLRMEFERGRRESEKNFEERIRSVTAENSSLQSTNNQLQSRLQSLDQSHSSLQLKVHSLEQELSSTRQEIANLRQSNHQLSVQNSDWERSADGLRVRLEGCEKALAAREDQVRSLERERLEESQTRGRLEETLEGLKIQNAGLDEGFRKASEEINKGNEIIRKIQTDLKSAKSKIKLKNVVTLQQEKLLDERASIIEMHEKELAALKQALSKQEGESGEYKAKIEELTKSVEEGKKIISENTHVIEWLHKQLNEEALNKPGVGNYGRIDFEKFASNNNTNAASSAAPATTAAAVNTGYQASNSAPPGKVRQL
ncbi:hypothetical protein BDR26DRAFT_620753 [Obelidium mucronatum]|nr:hypothetical protein BDR26DRAFT_620753 [Obelidium mucronatum]